MLHQKSTPKEIEYYIQQVEMLAMNEVESKTIAKIIALRELVSDESIKELIAEDLKDETWIDETNILINTCNKRQIKSTVLQSHIQQCKNFIVFRYLEDKLYSVKEISVTKNPWIFKEVDNDGKESVWFNSKFLKIFDDSSIRGLLSEIMSESDLIINNDLLHKNRDNIYSQDIFEDLDFLINKKKRMLES
ncbi:hypothetical protein GW796_06220 [archaeon]|nr:hypothetical protein [archaeon]